MFHHILKSYETLSINCCNSINSFSKTFIALFVFVIALQFNGNAQGTAYPSCNISGPLEAVASGPDITINVEIAHSTANPNISYEFVSNSSNAFIRSQGPVVYNAAKNSVTQKLIVCPGNQGSEFNLKLEVVTPNGTSRCSKSVSVSQTTGGSTGSN